MRRRTVTLDQIPEEDLQGIGRVAAAWSELENQVERIVWRLAGMDDNRGASVTTHMSIKARLDAACALAELLFPDSEQEKRLRKLAKRTSGTVYGKRNEIVHSRLASFPDLPGGITVRLTTKARGTLKKQPIPTVDSEYDSVTNEILDLASEFQKALADFIGMIAVK